MDRLQWRVDRALLVLLLVGLPFTAWLAGSVTYDRTQDAMASQEATRRPVAARLLQDAVPAGRSGAAGAATARVEWREGASARDAAAAVEPGARAGDVTTVWLDRGSGEVTTAPLSPSAAVSTTVAAALAAAGGAGLAGGGTRAGVHRALDRRRYARWDAEWARVEPRWTGRDDGGR
ncbi:hypothetical protein [Streptomyces sp. CC228A]|uniref:Rv1733c family protein n=1 Tax=Streptomyces sp. CC228A TaxID=2898186 RepID=UPI001F40971C|nr:hypothetical protein [Streptomyces sp. CC228A]